MMGKLQQKTAVTAYDKTVKQMTTLDSFPHNFPMFPWE